MLRYQLLSGFDVEQSVSFVYARFLQQVIEFAYECAGNAGQFLQLLSQDVLLPFMNVKPVLMNKLIAFLTNFVKPAELGMGE
jgi:hypothetical protein